MGKIRNLKVWGPGPPR